MDALDFIASDVERSGPGRRAARILGLIALAALPAVLGLGLREGPDRWIGVAEPRVLGLNVVAALGLAAALGFGARGAFSARARVAWVLLAVSLACAGERVIFGGTFGLWPSGSDWTAIQQCFLKGATEAMVCGALVLLLAFGAVSMPTRRWRLVLSAAAGVSSAVMLGFHCDSALAAHFFFGHVAPGVFVAALVAALAEAVFRARLRARLPRLIGRLARPEKLS